MTITVEWGDESRSVVCNHYEGNWTWEEYYEAARQTNELIKMVPHMVDVIVNMKPGIMPKGGAGIGHAKAVLRAAPPNRRFVVIVINPLIGALSNIFKKLDADFDNILFGVNSLEDAYRLLDSKR